MIFLILCIVLIPWILGSGILRVLYGKERTGEFVLWDVVLTGIIAVIGLGEAAHLGTLFLHRTFSFYTMLFGILTAVVSVAVLGVLFLMRLKEKKTSNGTGSRKNVVPFVLPVFLFATQMAWILQGSPYLRGDMTAETILSFFQMDGIYQVNPMTGNAYEGGIPLRLSILCLPSLYGGLCKIFSLHPQVVVWNVVPCVTLVCCYGAFWCVGRCLFAEDLKKRSCFITLVGLLLWVGNYAMGMDGFGVLNSGWRGVVIRNVVLLPYLVSLCLRKKWKLTALCIVAEACMVWTFYGAGACLLAAVGMKVCEWVGRKLTDKGRGEAAG